MIVEKTHISPEDPMNRPRGERCNTMVEIEDAKI